jgi:DNA-binding transcriptional ArsR family regulator
MPRNTLEDKLFLLHPTRRSIYRIICENPGTYFYRLMSEIPKYDKKVSSATLLYHLSKLEEDGIIKSDKIDGKRIFFPKNLRTKEIERAFMLLKNNNARKIFLYIVNFDNCFQNQLARALNLHHDSIRHHVLRLKDAELIDREKKGKHVRFSIGRLGREILEGSLSIFSETYVRFIISKLADDCHFPEIVSQTAEKLIIRVVCPREDDLELSIDISHWTIDYDEGEIEELIEKKEETAKLS